MKKIFLSTLLLIAVCTTKAQSQNNDTAIYWAKNPVLHTVTDSFKTESAVAILDERKVQYKNIGKEQKQFLTYHKIVRINNDKGIEMFNKVYIPIYRNAELQNVQARTISASGKVYDITNDKIKEIEENQRKYKLFAMEGVEKGAEVEYTYTIEKPLSYFGEETFQNAIIPIQQLNFILIIPSYLKFDVKGYNGLVVHQDVTQGNERVIFANAKDIPTVAEEKYGFREKYLMGLNYKLSYNLSTNPNVRLYTWQDFGKRAFEIYTNRTSKEDKAIDALVDKIKIDPNSDEPHKILAVEDYVKSNFNIDKKLITESGNNIENIIQTKSCNEEGVTRLFTALFDKANIPYQLVFTPGRSNYPIDEAMENWLAMDYVMLYFPDTKKYISPVSIELRYPYIPFDFAGCKALFLKPIDIGNFKTAVTSINEVALEPFDQHAINMESYLKFNSDIDTLYIRSNQILKGYGATEYRPIYTFLPKDKQDEINKQIIKGGSGGNSEISNIKIENTAFTSYIDNKPLIISADVKSTELLEKAGNNIIVKVGEIIGPQVQMYQEKPRKLPEEIPFPHVLQRVIHLQIPDGYVVKNLKDAEMNIVYKDGNDLTMGFVSTAKQTGQDIEIEIDETYARIYYPLSQYEEFKKVINAAADFNKVVLVLQKK